MKFNLESLKSLLRSDAASEYIGQGLIQIPKFGISLISTDLGNKLINGIGGAIGNIVNERYSLPGRTKDILRAALCNMMFGAADPTATQLRSMKRSAEDMIAAIKYRQFGTAFGTLLEEPETIVTAIREWIPSFGKGSLSESFKSLAGSRALDSERGITAISPKQVSVYSPDTDLTKKDIISY